MRKTRLSQSPFPAYSNSTIRAWAACEETWASHRGLGLGSPNFELHV